MLNIKPFPHKVNRYKWQVVGYGDLTKMRKLAEQYNGTEHKITEPRPQFYQFWVRKRNINKNG